MSNGTAPHDGMAGRPRYVPRMVTSSDPDQQPSEATAEAEVEPSLVEDVHASPDHVLVTLVRLVNNLPSAEIGLTLYVGGSIVSGLLVSGHSYFKLLSALVAGDGTDPSRTAFASIFQRAGEVYPESSEEDDEPKFSRTGFIHLRAASVHTVGSTDTIDQDLWRGRLSRVDGWSMGNFGPKPRLPKE